MILVQSLLPEQKALPALPNRDHRAWLSKPPSPGIVRPLANSQSLLPEKRYLYYPNLAKAVGSDFLAARVAQLQPDLHLFGHVGSSCCPSCCCGIHGCAAQVQNDLHLCAMLCRVSLAGEWRVPQASKQADIACLGSMLRVPLSEAAPQHALCLSA